MEGFSIHLDLFKFLQVLFSIWKWQLEIFIAACSEVHWWSQGINLLPDDFHVSFWRGNVLSSKAICCTEESSSFVAPPFKLLSRLWIPQFALWVQYHFWVNYWFAFDIFAFFEQQNCKYEMFDDASHFIDANIFAFQHWISLVDLPQNHIMYLQE